MYILLIEGIRMANFNSFVRAVRLAQMIHEDYNVAVDIILSCKKDHLRISWSSQKSYIGNHGGSFGCGDCMKTHKRIAKKFGWWNA